MRRRHVCLVASASALLAACGASNAGIVFDATTPPAPTTTIPLLIDTTVPALPTTSVVADPPTPSTAPRISTSSTTHAADPPDETGPDGDGTVAVSPPTGPTTTKPASTCTTAGCSGAQIVTFPSLTQVPQFGDDPVRGSGCGLADEFGNSMPDGLYFGLLSPQGGDVSFDVVCVYYGESAIDKGAEPGPESDFFPVNAGTRQREVPLAGDFVYRVGTWAPDGQCVDAGPAGNADWDTVDDGTAAWLMIADGDATGAVAMCPL